MQRVLHRTLKGLVVFGEGSVGEGAKRPEDSSDAFGIHDEGPHVFLGGRVCLEIWNVVSHPRLGGFTPPDLLPVGVPRLSIGITGCAVVKNATIRRPRPRPVLIDA